MICCTAIALLFGLIGLPAFRWRAADALAWRPAIGAAARPRPSLVASFGHAFAGIRLLVREERNARLHVAGAIVTILAGFAFGISLSDWRWLILAIGLVLSAEALNTAIERVCDRASPEHHPLIKAAKDVAAGAVLLLAGTSLLIGVLTFLPYAVRHASH